MNLKFSFLVGCCLSVAAVACGGNPAPAGEAPVSPEAPEGGVTAIITTADRTQSFKKTTLKLSTGPKFAPVIVLNPAVCYQSMDGFGAAITGSTCYNLMKMTPTDRTAFLTGTFSDKEGLGFSYIRISIGCSDFSLSEYTCCDKPGIENFSLQSEETDYVIPVLKEILAISPDIKILGSPWTCPKWMKVNNLEEKKPFDSWTSGQLNPDCYRDYAAYFVKWVQAFDNEGIRIYSVTPQNEPLNRGNSASLFMGWKEEQAFVREALGPAFKAAGLNTKIYAFDHNYNYDNLPGQDDYPVKMYDDETAAAFLTGAAYHNYGGNREELNDIRRQRPDKELIFTETSIGMWNDGRNLTKRLMEDMREVALGTVNNWCRAVMVWNLMLDTERGPWREGGCKTCYGAVDIDPSDYKTITCNSHYYVIGHLSSVVKPGARRIESTGPSTTGLMYSAFQNPDGTMAFVLLNENESAARISLTADGKHYINCELPGKSVASYRWKK
ncbi:glycoside hydrolase family 30 beta sandwich domain-containing protein [Bacteroides helcogenes]|uniref:Glucan endo-1,6-beta-glucosidase n=1 Tax=Bacteroides helcogenes (strain ATCC 35417 / DSM 20613 / JCM 6297 / CCUG 15421 / P 36-108) TaxID=693979 RepID=E6SWN8_BACT6|nr:glycoside hydrolase family 30 beta sandwich domain-containing protein [Bacteroides helcogenes]ADV42636.1 Glucan endo-1,6-beta-glucosidase [Bacteroides helcogenes P 36-108]MDY5239467.1 glycoside hydrolase family 30 beta sandwich domain-containing protein [Bacteroides helcogenes]